MWVCSGSWTGLLDEALLSGETVRKANSINVEFGYKVDKAFKDDVLARQLNEASRSGYIDQQDVMDIYLFFWKVTVFW